MGERQYQIPAPWESGRRKSRVMIDCFGGAEMMIETRRGVVRFECSEMFGPLPIKKDGQQRDLVPSHPFWRAASLWKLQGKRMDGTRAIWHEPRKPVYETVPLRGGGRLITKVIDEGEPGHDW